MVETAIIMTVLIMLTLGSTDIGIATYRYNTISQAARQGARQAMVHGALAAPAMTVWGPGNYSGTAADGSPYAQAVSPMLVGMNLNNVTITVEWIDGGNAIQQRVRFTVSTTYRPLVTFIFAKASYPLSASSTLPIAH